MQTAVVLDPAAVAAFTKMAWWLALSRTPQTRSPIYTAPAPQANRMLNYHSDSSGIYIRSLDSKAFSLDSMDFMAPITSDENPDSGPNDFWDILGFNTALNPGLDTGTGNCEDYATCVAYQKVANGFNGTLSVYE